ncbi:hypothetical protein PAHAL_9G246000 [Panicum hallii]|uniref:Uncharacterized protein n=1 Tax=Panicum hallii TaxID=206008 RepID=A0A2T8I2E2_9POAL|nr:hypothetical protein PAHAL_9G246000 [Panicum hallii]
MLGGHGRWGRGTSGGRVPAAPCWISRGSCSRLTSSFKSSSRKCRTPWDYMSCPSATTQTLLPTEIAFTPKTATCSCIQCRRGSYYWLASWSCRVPGALPIKR